MVSIEKIDMQKSCTSNECKCWVKGFETNRLVQHTFLAPRPMYKQVLQTEHSSMNAMERENRKGKQSRSWSSRAQVEELDLHKPHSGSSFVGKNPHGKGSNRESG